MPDPIVLPPRPRIPTGRDVARALNPQPGWAARLFGGADPLQQGLLSLDQTRGLGRSALLNAGLNILANSGPSPYRRGLGEILAGGALAGQQAYQQGSQNLLGQQGMLQQRQMQARRAAIGQKYEGRTDPQSLQAMLGDLIAIGDFESARPLSEYLKSLRGQAANSDYVRGVIGPDGKPAVAIMAPGSTTPQGYLPQVPEVVRPTNTRAATNAITKTLYDPFTVKTINAYHQFQSHIAEARRGNPAAYKAAVSAFITNAEPSNQLRLGMLQYLQEVDPSLTGNAEIVAQRFKNGTWPPHVIEGMQRVVDDNYRQVRERVQGLYDWYLNADPEAVADVPPPAVRFGDAVSAPPSSAPMVPGATGGMARGFQFKAPGR